MTSSDHVIPIVLIASENQTFESVARTRASMREGNGDVMMSDVVTEVRSAADTLSDQGQYTTPVNRDPAATIEESSDFSTENKPNQKEEIKAYSSRNINQTKNFLLAANYIEDARFGRTLEYNTDSISLNNYRRYSSTFLQWTTLAFMWYILFLALFEEPSVKGLRLPYWATILMELTCLAVIIFRMYQLSRFVPRRALLTDPKNIVIFLTIFITLLDMVIYIGMMQSSTASKHAIRVSRVLRPMFFINMNESRQVRRAFRNIRNTVPEILSVLVLFMFSIAVFTLLAFKLFETRGLYYRSGESYFTDYWDTFFDLYVLVTTANSPDVMMPAYDYSPWFALFFIVYIIVNTYIFINLFLAVIYNSYRAHLKTEIRTSVLWKRKKLDKAFEILQDYSEEAGKPIITHETWICVMKELARPPSYPKMNLYWEVLNHGKDQNNPERETYGITKEDFLHLANLMNVYIVQDTSNKNIFIKWAPQVYSSRPSKLIRKCVNHKFFAYFFDLLIIANAICIAFNLEVTEWFFLSVFIFEIILKMYTLGPKEYFSLYRLWNWFDFIIITTALIATIIEAFLGELEGFPREVLDFLMVMRCLRLVKIVGNIPQFQVIVMTVVNIAPSLATYGIVLLMIYYSFAIVGMECFGGKIVFINDGTSAWENKCGNEKLDGSEFLRVGYCNNNFNDVLHSLVTLIELTVVNQWHIITLGYTLVTSKAARVYFICFHLIVVILIMNIIVAFVLEAFILEYSLSKTHIESKVEKTIEELGLSVDVVVDEANNDRTELINDMDGYNDQYTGKREDKYGEGPRHRFTINRGHKNVEVLLQRMFEDELEEDTGNNATSDEQVFTLDNVTGTCMDSNV